MAKSDLPFGAEFSPQQIDLCELLEFAKEHEGYLQELQNAVRERYFESHDTSPENRRKLAMNTGLAMIAYEIVDRAARLTAFGETLYSRRNDPSALDEALAKHILLHLNGTNFVQCVLDMQAADEDVTLVSLRHSLEERGINLPRGSRHMSTMRLWLQKAGVFVQKWRVDEVRFRELVGISEQELETLALLSPEQRAYLKTMVNMGGESQQSNEIERLAAVAYGVQFNEKNLPKSVLYPLRDAGFVTLERGTKKAGRGAKPFLVTPTDRLRTKIVTPLLEQLEQVTAADVKPLLRRSLSDIRNDVKSADKHIAGLALEALAFKLMRLIGLEYVATRLRGSATGGAEVDLIFESSRLVFSRWQVQCKRTDRIALDDVAKEVGLTHLLKSNVVVMVGTGQIGSEARKYANKIMTDSNLCIVMIDERDIGMIGEKPAGIVDVLNREARHAMQIKKIEL